MGKIINCKSSVGQKNGLHAIADNLMTVNGRTACDGAIGLGLNQTFRNFVYTTENVELFAL